MMQTNYGSKAQKFRRVQSAIYDYMYEAALSLHFDNHLDWPCTTVQWGSVLCETEEYIRQKVYFACRTDGEYNEVENTWKKIPAYLVVASMDIPKSGKSFNQELRDIFLQDKLKKHSNLKVKQLLIHPGDANAMKKSYRNQKLLATKNDFNTIFVWNLSKHKGQPRFFTESCHSNTPDITLTGHQCNQPSFALEWSKTSYRVASGCADKRVLVWNLEDYQSRITSASMFQSKRELNSIGSTDNIRVTYSNALFGHQQQIEDLSFSPKFGDVLVSVGDDRKVFGWDLRVSNQPSFEIPNLHSDDINAVDWNQKNEQQIATGSSDATACITDLRNTKEPLYRINAKKPGAHIVTLKFSPHNENYLALGSDNLYFYDTIRPTSEGQLEPIFTHFGHRGVVNDFDWNFESQWSIISTCLDSSDSMGGGSLQVYRPLELYTMDREQAIKKLAQAFTDNGQFVQEQE